MQVHKLPPAEMHGLVIILSFGKDIAGNLEIMNFLIPYTKRLEGKGNNLFGQKHSC